MRPLPDGIYDVIVVDAENLEEGDMRLEVTVTLGPYVGDVIALRGRHLGNRREVFATSDPEDLLGVCGTLRVRRGVPAFHPER